MADVDRITLLGRIGRRHIKESRYNTKAQHRELLFGMARTSPQTVQWGICPLSRQPDEKSYRRNSVGAVDKWLMLISIFSLAKSNG
jgi:hypothetical protein